MSEILRSILDHHRTPAITYAFMIDQFGKLVDQVRDTLEGGGKIIFLGNGGSCAMASHLAAEFVVRFKRDRRALPAIALNDAAMITAAGNDYSFDLIFTRQLEAWMLPNDMVIALSTSGASQNVILALDHADHFKVRTGLLTGRGVTPMYSLDDDPLKDLYTVIVRVPSNETARIQEVHLMLGHALCAEIDAWLIPNSRD